MVLTNPDMLHVGILPNHGRWATFLMRLRYVVLDELHTFRGIFGTHVAHLLRRLRRITECYAAHPPFLACSATIGDPAGLASALWGEPVAAVTDDGPPRGARRREPEGARHGDVVVPVDLEVELEPAQHPHDASEPLGPTQRTLHAALLVCARRPTLEFSCVGAQLEACMRSESCAPTSAATIR